MTTTEVNDWADVMAEDCMRYGIESRETLKKTIADHLRDAYLAGQETVSKIEIP
jgi:hypothetical protein